MKRKIYYANKIDSSALVYVQTPQGYDINKANNLNVSAVHFEHDLLAIILPLSAGRTYVECNGS